MRETENVCCVCMSGNRAELLNPSKLEGFGGGDSGGRHLPKVTLLPDSWLSLVATQNYPSVSELKDSSK